MSDPLARLALSEEIEDLRAARAEVDVLVARLQSVAGGDGLEAWHGRVETRLIKPRLCHVCKKQTGEIE